MKRILPQIRADVEAIARDEALYEEKSFCDRLVALDFLEFDVIERVDSLLLTCGRHGELLDLRQRAERVKKKLEGVDRGLFQRFRDGIASRSYTGAALKRLILEYAGDDPGAGNEGDEGYDALDALVNGFLLMEDAPEETRARAPEMVFYQPTPVRIVLELVEKANFQPHDLFYDVGSGLGQVAILVHLLSGVRVTGIEFEPAYCDYARRCASALNLSRVAFVNADAREADYAHGRAFFMYTPFEGKMLEQVLERLEAQAGGRGIRLYTYGPCTLQVARQSWLERVDRNGDEVYKLAIFETPVQALEIAQPAPGAGTAFSHE